ncbi:hypothetical protein FHX48_000034 [Microbacterium halimionae]|uniref:Uncharacterized protein n=1 Tax=Microbacterium halimionae TaxID=1526413 RepID=A0A7W3JL93_9MICO|nr:hypothetical protein [Microbacterium halimionae]MBA8814982.1 hypothetical protein [Microbacterium halimionae]NII94227.1 hypothetical protein [Microbacterium halimionae]
MDEYTGPPKHRGESDRFECGSVDELRREESARYGEVANHSGCGATQYARNSSEHPGGCGKEPSESGDHAVRHDVVKTLIERERDTTGERQVGADQSEKDSCDASSTSGRIPAGEASKIGSYPAGENNHKHACDGQRCVEHGAGCGGEHSETTEVEVPPHGIRGGEDCETHPHDENAHNRKPKLRRCDADRAEGTERAQRCYSSKWAFNRK